MLGWKKINADKVAESYQQCRELALIVYEETDRIMRDCFCHAFMETFTEDEWTLLLKVKPDETCVRICQEYSNFLFEAASSSPDAQHRFLSNYLLIMRKYILYCQSEKEGDAVMMEYIMFKLLPAFRFAGKTNIFSTTVKVMERQYALPAYVLQLVRVNRT